MAQLADGARVRPAPFGAVAYVPSRDTFYALDSAYAEILRAIDAEQPVSNADPARLRRMAELGLVNDDQHTPQVANQEPGLIGEFPDLPVAGSPLLVNCFATAKCALACRYCYSDDLMQQASEDSEDGLVDRVKGTAEGLGALVAVITGGEPLARPRQAADLLAKLATTMSVVLDTSGVGDFEALLSVLIDTKAHVRVSMDSAVAEIHDAQRPIRKPYQQDGSSSWAYARKAIAAASAAGVPVSVQTVLTSRNSSLTELSRLRDLIAGLGVRKWVLHVVVTAGKARRTFNGVPAVRPDLQLIDQLTGFAEHTARQRYPMDMRFTDNNTAPNSVLIIDSYGQLRTEAEDGRGKVIIPVGNGSAGVSPIAGIDMHSHYSRYLNCDILSITGDRARG